MKQANAKFLRCLPSSTASAPSCARRRRPPASDAPELEEIRQWAKEASGNGLGDCEDCSLGYGPEMTSVLLSRLDAMQSKLARLEAMEKRLRIVLVEAAAPLEALNMAGGTALTKEIAEAVESIRRVMWEET